jgi:radical SAM protein with 4Fe4S-binding SPASM domain
MMTLEEFKKFSAEVPEVMGLKNDTLNRRSEVRERLYKEPDLRHLFFELTLSCNEHCFHCGSGCALDAPSGLSVEKYGEILDEVAANFDKKRIQICITGGEPMLRKDFFDIVGMVHEKGFGWGMTSNATLITKENARRLKECGMATISVSIDGLRDTHDAQRGLRGGYDLAMRGIQNLIDEDCFHAIQITTVINHKNIAELDELFEIVNGIDVDSWRVIGIEPIGRALDHPDMLLTPEDQRRMFSFILEKRREGFPVEYGCSHFLGADLEGNVRNRMFLCNAGVFTASIRADGSVTGCLDIMPGPETVFGNVMTESFTDIWNNRFETFRKHLSERNKDCRECEYEKWCAGGAHHSFDYVNNKPLICFKDILF